MKVGDLVRYHQSENILVVVGKREDHNKATMFRCYCPHLQDYYWFYTGSLEVIHESR